MARPEGFEPPTTWFEARYSIQLSYGRAAGAQFKQNPTGLRVLFLPIDTRIRRLTRVSGARWETLLSV